MIACVACALSSLRKNRLRIQQQLFRSSMRRHRDTCVTSSSFEHRYNTLLLFVHLKRRVEAQELRNVSADEAGLHRQPSWISPARSVCGAVGPGGCHGNRVAGGAGAWRNPSTTISAAATGIAAGRADRPVGAETAAHGRPAMRIRGGTTATARRRGAGVRRRPTSGRAARRGRSTTGATSVNPVWDDGFRQWGFYLFGLWIPVFGIG